MDFGKVADQLIQSVDFTLPADDIQTDEEVPTALTMIKKWMGSGLKKVYLFLHQYDEKDTPILASYTIQQFNKHLGAKIPEIKFITKQP